MKSSVRHIGKQNSVLNVVESTPGAIALNESDTNADTCCLGQNFAILSYTNRTADVYPYDSSYEPILNVPIVSGATVYKHDNGKSYLLVINEALYYGRKLDHSLINPNQIRHEGHGYWDNPYDNDHDLAIETADGIDIPLVYNGTKLAFQTHAPSDNELENLERIILTSKSPWDPHNVSLGKVKIKDKPERHRSIQNVICSINGFDIVQEKKVFADHKSDDIIFCEVNSPFVNLKETFTDINVNETLDTIKQDVPARRTFISFDRHRKTNIDNLAENWCIGKRKAADTINVTTQRGIRSAILPLSRRYRADRQFGTKRLNSKFATDTIWSDIKSLNQHKYAQVYTHKCGFAACYPIDRFSGDQIGYSLRDFISNFGVPEHLTFDGYSSHVGQSSLFMKTVRDSNIDFHISGVRRPNENPAEGSIRQIKQRWYRIMTKKQVPRRLWDYGLVWTCETGNLCVSSSRYAKKRSAIEMITGETPDISEYTDFGFYDWVTYHINAGLGDTQLGRWLGVSHKI